MILLLLLMGVGQEHTPTEYADVIEVNNYYDENHSLRFRQIIYWRWQKDQLHVAHWRLYNNAPSVYRYRNTWVDTYSFEGKLVQVKAKSFRETHTDYDPEREDQKTFPPENRKWSFYRGSPVFRVH